ncbi:hypothetical protein K6U06_16230 [Acidiferrimicrobium sp. IK]|nr:hypothetical protein [Acidiferrimicrobium sp. IK]MCU4185919.1 hypothetical protein [Acidiferrimicrobium sp. IK]
MKSSLPNRPSRPRAGATFAFTSSYPASVRRARVSAVPYAQSPITVGFTLSSAWPASKSTTGVESCTLPAVTITSSISSESGSTDRCAL